MNPLKHVGVALMISAALPQAADAAPVAPSPSWAGTWQLNLRESMFSGAAPKWERRTIAIRGREMTTRSSGEMADGRPIRFSYTVKLDGEFHPLVGNPDGDSISMQLISPQRVEIEVRRHGQRSATAVSAVSPNRIRMERHRLPQSGSPSDDMLVYHRVR